MGDPTIEQLVAWPKTVSGTARSRTDDASYRLDVPLVSSAPGSFRVFVRILRDLAEHFSMGLAYRTAPGAQETVLIRLNGDHGHHKNPDGGQIESGPHLHFFIPPLLLEPPPPGAKHKWAWPLPPEFVSAQLAWPKFCEHASVVSTSKVDRSIRKLYRAAAQTTIPLGDDDFG